MRRRRRGDKARVIYGPVPIISIKYMSQALRSVGYQADTLVYEWYSINRRDDFDYTADDFFDAIAGLLKFRERVEHRQSCAGRRFVSNRKSAVARGLKQTVVFDLRNGERLLVGEDDMEALLERFLD